MGLSTPPRGPCAPLSSHGVDWGPMHPSRCNFLAFSCQKGWSAGLALVKAAPCFWAVRRPPGAPGRMRCGAAGAHLRGYAFAEGPALHGGLVLHVLDLLLESVLVHTAEYCGIQCEAGEGTCCLYTGATGALLWNTHELEQKRLN